MKPTEKNGKGRAGVGDSVNTDAHAHAHAHARTEQVQGGRQIRNDGHHRGPSNANAPFPAFPSVPVRGGGAMNNLPSNMMPGTASLPIPMRGVMNNPNRSAMLPASNAPPFAAVEAISHSRASLRGYDMNSLRGYDMNLLRGYDMNLLRGYDMNLLRGYDMNLLRGYDMNLLRGYGMNTLQTIPSLRGAMDNQINQIVNNGLRLTTNASVRGGGDMNLPNSLPPPFVMNNQIGNDGGHGLTTNAAFPVRGGAMNSLPSNMMPGNSPPLRHHFSGGDMNNPDLLALVAGLDPNLALDMLKDEQRQLRKDMHKGKVMILSLHQYQLQLEEEVERISRQIQAMERQRTRRHSWGGRSTPPRPPDSNASKSEETEEMVESENNRDSETGLTSSNSNASKSEEMEEMVESENNRDSETDLTSSNSNASKSEMEKMVESENSED